VNLGPTDISFPQKWTVSLDITAANTEKLAGEAGMTETCRPSIKNRCGVGLFALGTLSADIRRGNTRYSSGFHSREGITGLNGPRWLQVYLRFIEPRGNWLGFCFWRSAGMFLSKQRWSSGQITHCLCIWHDSARGGRHPPLMAVFWVAAEGCFRKNGFTNFHNVIALAPQKHCQPFDCQRKGLMIGGSRDGWCAWEKLMKARNKNRYWKIYSMTELLGYGLSWRWSPQWPPTHTRRRPGQQGGQMLAWATLGTAPGLSPELSWGLSQGAQRGTGTQLNDFFNLNTEKSHGSPLFKKGDFRRDEQRENARSSIKSMIGISMGAAISYGIDSLLHGDFFLNFFCFLLKRELLPRTIQVHNAWSGGMRYWLVRAKRGFEEIEAFRYCVLNNSFAFGREQRDECVRSDLFGRIEHRDSEGTTEEGIIGFSPSLLLCLYGE